MQPVIRFGLVALLFLGVLAGCGAPSYPKNEAGAKANDPNATYTKDDAKAAIPDRHASDKGDE